MITNNKGFTLIEITTVAVVLAILGAFTFAFFNNAVTIYIMGSRQQMLYQEASYVMERITRELRDAESVSIGTGTLTIAKVHTSGTIDSSTAITFSIDNKGNILRSSAGIDRIMARNAQSLDFSPGTTSCSAGSANCLVTVTLQLTDASIPVADGSSKTVSLISAVSPRNIAPTTDAYSGRCFNGNYEDSVQQ